MTPSRQLTLILIANSFRPRCSAFRWDPGLNHDVRAQTAAGRGDDDLDSDGVELPHARPISHHGGDAA